MEISITNRAPYPSCQISTKALLNCICPVFTNNLSRSDQFLVTNIHTYVSVCVYTAMHRKGYQEPNASFKHWGNQEKKAGLPNVHCYISIPNARCKKRLKMVTQLVRNKYPTLPSPQRNNSRKKGHSLLQRQSECFLAMNSSPLLQTSCLLPQGPREC